MTQIESLKRRNLVLGLLALLLLAYVVFRPSETSAVTTDALPALFPDLDAAAVRTVTLERIPLAGQDGDAETIRLQRADETGWVLASSHGYPASADKVNRFLEDLQGTRRKKFITERAETFDEYAGPQGWTHVQVLAQGGQTVADFHVGKSAGWPDSFAQVKEDGRPAVIRAYNLSASEVRLTPEAWSEARLWPGLTLPDVGRLLVYRQGSQVADLFFQREVRPVEPKEGEAAEGEPTTETVWVMQGAEPTEAERMQVEGLIRSFTGMRFSRVAGRATDAAEAERYGLAEPALRVSVFEAQEGDAEPKRLGVLLVGREVPAAEEGGTSDRVYVSREDDEWVFEVTLASVADFRQQADDFLAPPAEPEEPAEPAAPGDTTGSPDDGDDPDAPPPPGDLPPLPPDDPDAPQQPEEPKDE